MSVRRTYELRASGRQGHSSGGRGHSNSRGHMVGAAGTIARL